MKPVRPWIAYASSIALPAMILFARLASGFEPGDHPAQVLFLIPIIISAYFGGLGPGLVATALSAFFIIYFLIEPIYQLSIASGFQRTMWSAFIITGVLVSLLNETMYRSRRRAEEALAQLKVAEEELLRQKEIRAEKALRQSEQQLELALSAARMVTFVWDPAANVMTTSGAFSEIFGRPPVANSEEAFALVHPDDRERHRATIEKTVREGGSYVMAFRIIRPDNGSIVWIEDRGDVVLDEAGQVKLVAGAAMDVTKRKEMEEALRESEQKFSIIYDKAPFAVSLARLPDAVIVNVNDAWVGLYGYAKQEAVGKTSVQLGINRDAGEGTRLLALLQKWGAVRNLEATFFTKSGDERIISCNIDLVVLRGQKYYLSTVNDITERKRAQEALKKSHAELELRVSERTAELSETNKKLVAEIEVRRKAEEGLRAYEKVVEGLEEMIVVVDRNYRYQIANRAFLAYREMERDQVVGRFVQELLDKEVFEKVVKNNLDETLQGKVVKYELEYTYPTFGKRDLLISYFPIEGPAGIDGVACVLQDITERKRAETKIKNLNADLERRVAERTAELEAVNKELEAFSYSVSHDLRAPLRATGGFSRVLLTKYADRLDAQGKDFLQRIDAASQRMAELIEDLLNLSRVARSELRREEIDLTLLARSIADELRRSEPERSVTFLIQEHLKISGDARLLKIVLENLLGNAWKFTSHHPTGTIEVGVTEKNGRAIHFVRDDGAGFDMAYSDKLFGAFQRLHTADEFTGTGIGLATVQRIIHRHGGEVWVEGKVEEGATIYFSV